jgi:hypothetical protein
MKSTLLAAAISGMVIGASALAQAATTNHGSTPDSLDSSAQQLDDKGSDKHTCKGKNACKGQGGCKSEKHACKGQNACKGQGGCKG